MDHYVLICAGQSDAGGSVEARQAFEKLLLLLLTERFWPHGRDGAEPRLPQAGDRVLFCLAANGGPELIGDATVAASSRPLTDQQLAECRLYLGPAMPPGPDALTHAVVLERTRVWERSIIVADDDGPIAFDLARALGGIYRTGGVRAVGEAAYEWLMSQQRLGSPAHDPPTVPVATVPAPEPPAVRPSPQPREPAHLPASSSTDAARAFLAAYWPLVDFGERLELIEGPVAGRSITTPAGPVDFACLSPDTGDLVALICLNGEPLAQMGQALTQRLAWMREYLAQPGQHVRGMVVLTGATAGVEAIQTADMQVRQLRVSCPTASSGPASEPAPDTAQMMDEWDLPGARPFAARSVAPEPVAASVSAVLGPLGPARPEPVTLDFAAKCHQVARDGRNGVHHLLKRW
jgi:hypothetical protein